MTLIGIGVSSLILSFVCYVWAMSNVSQNDTKSAQFFATIGYILQFIAVLIALMR